MVGKQSPKMERKGGALWEMLLGLDPAGSGGRTKDKRVTEKGRLKGRGRGGGVGDRQSVAGNDDNKKRAE